MSCIFDIIDIEEKLGVTFSDKAILKRAFTHSSYANEKKIKSNENLEFLGDSILNFVVTEHICSKHSDCAEGELSMFRAAVVSFKPLAEIIANKNLGEHMFLGAGESKAASDKENIYADLFEAIIGAIYLDKGLDSAKKFILTMLDRNLQAEVKSEKVKDYKSKLQEFVQREKNIKLEYREVERQGPDHSPVFVFEVLLNDERTSVGSGKNKREAQQAAAERALEIKGIV